MTMADDLSGPAPFIVRAFPANVTMPSVDLSRVWSLDMAIAMARTACRDRSAHYRQVIVTDDQGMTWAVFNMLWSIYEESMS